MNSTEKHVKILIAETLATLKEMDVIWKSDLPDHFKQKIFPATVKSIVMYDVTA